MMLTIIYILEHVELSLLLLLSLQILVWTGPLIL